MPMVRRGGVRLTRPTVRAALVAGVLAAGGCGEPSAPAAPAVVRAIVSDVAIGLGDTIRLGAVLYDRSGNVVRGRSTWWRSLDVQRATVDSATGLVTAHDTGSARIVVAARALEDTVRLTIERRVASVQFARVPDSVWVGGGDAMRAVALDFRGVEIVGAPLAWTSSDTTVLGIAATGALSGNGEGVAMVRVAAGSASSEVPVRVVFEQRGFGFIQVSQLALADTHGCALDPDGRAWCWGNSLGGRLGRGTITLGDQPFAPVAGDHRFVRIDAGDATSCGLTAANRLLCWGANAIPRNARSPVAILDSIPSGSFAVGMHNQSCAVATDGVLRCWGRNDTHQLARGPLTGYDTLPLPAAGDVRLRAAAVGWGGGCGAGTDDRAYCWGTMSAYQGDGAPRDRPLEVPGASPFAQVVVGATHACGLTPDGEAWCWGGNARGQLGGATVTSTGTPQRVGGGHAFVRLDSGLDHACGITEAGEVWCWGDGSAYGYGATTSESPPPRRFATPRRFRTFATAPAATCGVTLENVLLCTAGVPRTGF